METRIYDFLECPNRHPDKSCDEIPNEEISMAAEKHNQTPHDERITAIFRKDGENRFK